MNDVSGGPAAERIRVGRTARYHRLGGGGPGLREVWFVLHGYRQLAGRFLRYFADLDDGTRFLVAPEALSRFYVDPAEGRHRGEHRVGASWMTREARDDEIADYVEYLDRLAGHLPSAPRRVVLGFSQGGHTAARWAVLGQRPPDELVLWGAYLPEDLPPDATRARLSGSELTLVRGSGDVHADPDRAAAEDRRLDDWGIDPWILDYEGGHRIHGPALDDLARAIRARGDGGRAL